MSEQQSLSIVILLCEIKYTVFNIRDKFNDIKMFEMYNLLLSEGLIEERFQPSTNFEYAKKAVLTHRGEIVLEKEDKVGFKNFVRLALQLDFSIEIIKDYLKQKRRYDFYYNSDIFNDLEEFNRKKKFKQLVIKKENI